MGRKVWFFAGFSLILFLAHHFGENDPVIYFALLSVAVLCVVYFVLDKDTVSLCFSLIFSSLSLILNISRSRDPWSFVFLGGFFVVATVTLFYRKDCERMVETSNRKREAFIDQTASLKQKFDDKKGSLELMLKQLSEITSLYELARDLNDCLSFDKVVKILKERLFKSVVFQEASLLVFADEAETPSIVRKFVMHEGPEESESKWDLTGPEKRIILVAHEGKETIKIRTAADLAVSPIAGENIQLPVWIFPLLVQNRVIALFLVSGGSEDDLPKFEVVASQLALQVKKIKLYDTVRELSIIDGLTRVFVRRHFVERFEEELKRSIRHGFHLAVLMLDIDHFKSYNDNYGHLVGDVTLRDVAQVILSTVRRVDIVARYGGEEFAIVLPETDKSGATEVAERIRSAVAKKIFKAYDEETRVTVSIGLAAFPADLGGDSPKTYHSDLIVELLRKADEALYQAKEEGRNRVVLFERLSH